MSELLTAEERQAMRRDVGDDDLRTADLIDIALRALDSDEARDQQNVELDKWACRRITELETALATAERERDAARAALKSIG